MDLMGPAGLLGDCRRALSRLLAGTDRTVGDGWGRRISSLMDEGPDVLRRRSATTTDSYASVFNATNSQRSSHTDAPLLDQLQIWVPIGYQRHAPSSCQSGQRARRCAARAGQTKGAGRRGRPGLRSVAPPHYEPRRSGFFVRRGKTTLGTTVRSASGRRHYLRILPRQRLVGARHPGLGEYSRSAPSSPRASRRRCSPWIVTSEPLSAFPRRRLCPGRRRSGARPGPYLTAAGTMRGAWRA